MASTSLGPPAIPPLRYVKLHPEAIVPTRAYGEAIGYDLSAFAISEHGTHIQIILPPRTSKLIRTALAFMSPPGFFLSICSRSGLASHQPPIFVANAPAIIDPDYTGELKIILFNGGHETAYIRHGDRIAQLVCFPRPPHFLPEEIFELPSTERGVKGFGSTGV